MTHPTPPTDPVEGIRKALEAYEDWCARSCPNDGGKALKDFEDATSGEAIRELLERLDRAEVNARRYEWLRDKANMDTSAMAPMAFNAPGNGKPVQWRDALCGEKLDAAIDQAMKGKV